MIKKERLAALYFYLIFGPRIIIFINRTFVTEVSENLLYLLLQVLEKSVSDVVSGLSVLF